jgi:PAS domain S-box-containing protein
MLNTQNKSSGIHSWLYKELFQQVPFNLAIIDRNYNIIEANDNFAEYFGNWQGRKCFEVYKNLLQPCHNCEAFKTFEDGKIRVRDEAGIDQSGKKSHFVVHVAPLNKKEKRINYIIEISTDVTETKKWQREYNLLFDRVPCYITVIDSNYRIVRANESFRENFGDQLGEKCFRVYKKRKTKCPNCPAAKTFKDGKIHNSHQSGIKKDGDKAYYHVATSLLGRNEQNGNIKHVIEISTDITETKKLEQEIIDAERLAAVGQTVAGLAHSIKNILMGLEGGMYIVNRGLKRDDKEIINEGWEMLERNFNKTTTLVKDFLSFSKGRAPQLKMIDPNNLVTEIVNLYKDIANKINITLEATLSETVKQAPLDPEGIHTCLTNLVSNAIDSCEMSEKKDCKVSIETKEERGILSFIIADDGSGMDYNIKQKVFTTFFTTKGGKGTGLGLLTTKKIVMEHGGKIRVFSKKGEGARFIIELPKKRLYSLYKRD